VFLYQDSEMKIHINNKLRPNRFKNDNRGLTESNNYCRRSNRWSKVVICAIWFHYHYQLFYTIGLFRTQWWWRV